MQFLSTRQICKLTSLSKGAVCQALRNGELKGRKYHGKQNRKGKWVVAVEDYDNWVETFFKRNKS